MNPGGIRPPDDGRYVLREVVPGMFTVENAYAGRYEFFKGRATPAPPTNGHTDLNGQPDHATPGGDLSAE